MGHLINLSTACRLARLSTLSNKKVIFTHGAYDLFHSGHSYFLNQSKKRGDILIVGVDSDENIKKYKQFTRPIIPQAQRAEILINHLAVDFVFINDSEENNLDSYYINLYSKLKPHELTFGERFAVDPKLSESFKLVNYTKISDPPKSIGFSTTNIINIILEKYNQKV